MKRFMYSAFVAFLSSAAMIVVLARLVPGPRAPAPDAGRTIALEELARHATAQDCWMAIEGGVYDVTDYAPSHPAPPRVLLDWCGREATAAFGDKGAGRPHIPESRELLETFRVGTLR
ncbi:MAG: cytochrome b5-like heme/steroid binding domain-containing protein [Elusimicrobiota bacterium]|nr:cytochrome b5-like heme/steroid binding domain-containing protein [Elusimicrobiota bacterium]